MKGDIKMNETSKMWGGRFLKKPNEMMNAFQASIVIDRRLWREDIEGSLAHAKQLYEQGILGKEDYDKICEGLKKIMERAERGELEFSEELEDIHMNIEAALSEEIGLEAGGRLHTARSRNDQVALDSHLYLRRPKGGNTIQSGKAATMRHSLRPQQAVRCYNKR